MTLYHCTPRHNLSSIFLFGLLTSQARGKTPAVWFVERDGLWCQRENAAQRHGVPSSAIAILRVTIRAEMVRKAQGGRWFTLFDVSPDSIAETCQQAASLRRR